LTDNAIAATETKSM